MKYHMKYSDEMTIKGLLPPRLTNALSGWSKETTTVGQLRSKFNRTLIERLKNVGDTTLLEAEQVLHEMGVPGYEDPPTPMGEALSVRIPIAGKLWTCDGKTLSASGTRLTEAEVQRLLGMFGMVRKLLAQPDDERVPTYADEHEP